MIDDVTVQCGVPFMRRLALMVALALTALASHLVPAFGQAAPQAAPQPRSSREIAAGGLIMVPDYTLIVETVDVQLSTEEVRVSYAITNPTAEPRTIFVTFPLPDVDATAIGDQAIIFPKPDTFNFIGAVYAADGTPVLPRFDQRALAFGLDVTADLVAAGLPHFPYRADMAGRIARLPDDLRASFLERGLLRWEDDKLVAGWTLKTTAYWRQTFAPGKTTTLSLTYAPIVGGGPAEADVLDAVAASHCVTATARSAITKRAADAAGGAGRIRWMHYALTSGASWALPAASFRLRVRKPSPESVVTTCRKGLTAIGPTMLEWKAENFYPDDDVLLLISP